jgi:hypothetical protein
MVLPVARARLRGRRRSFRVVQIDAVHDERAVRPNRLSFEREHCNKCEVLRADLDHRGCLFNARRIG